MAQPHLGRDVRNVPAQCQVVQHFDLSRRQRPTGTTPAHPQATGSVCGFLSRIAEQIHNQPPRRHRRAAHIIQRLHHQNPSASRHLRQMRSPHTLPTRRHLATTAEQPNRQQARSSALTIAHLTSTGEAEGQAVSATPGYPAAARSPQPQRNLGTRGSTPR